MKKYLIAVLLVLASDRAYADTCAASLMPAFTANQATVLCTKLNDSIAESLVPQTTNAINLGSSSKVFNTAFLGGGGLNFQATYKETVAGAGSSVSDAAALSATTPVHQLTGANGTVGWKFVTATPIGSIQILLNTTAGVPKIYGEAGSTCNGGATDAACTLVTGIGPHICWKAAALTYICA